MRQMKIAIVTALASIAVACSSAAPPAPTGKDVKSQSETAPKTPTKTGAAAPSGDDKTATTASPTEPTKSAEGGDDACVAACDTKHAAGVKVYEDLDKASIACECQPSVCATQCAQSECKEDGAESKEGDACSTCLEGAAASKCEQQRETACKGNADCAAIEQCYNACEPADGEDDKDD
jgi:hypothetical protein